MKETIKFCPTCAKNEFAKISFINGERGYYSEYCKTTICRECNGELTDLNFDLDDAAIIMTATDSSFQVVKAMIELKKSNPVDYSLKLAQFKEIADNKNKSEEAERLIPKCPKCGSKSITTGQKGFGLIMGFVGSNKTVNRCGSCGHIWQPNK